MRRLLSLFVLLACAFTQAAEPIIINQPAVQLNLSDFADYLADESEAYSIVQLKQPVIASQFSPVHGGRIGKHLTNTPFWLRFQVRNNTGSDQKLFIKIDAPLLDSATLLNDPSQGSAFNRVTTGSWMSFRERPHQFGSYVLPFTVKPGLDEYHLMVRTLYPSEVSLRLLDENSLLRTESRSLYLDTISLTIIVLSALVAIAAGVLHQFKASIWGIAMPLALSVSLMGWTGLSARWIGWPTYSEILFINAGLFLSGAALLRFLMRSRSEFNARWIKDALHWGSLVLFSIVLLAIYSDKVIGIQLILLPLMSLALGLYWFKHPPRVVTERLSFLVTLAVGIYFAVTYFHLLGIISFSEWSLMIMRVTATAAATMTAWAIWKHAQMNKRQLAVEGLSIPNMHWPLLRKINHDIRGPINGVLGMTELLQDTTLSAHQQEYLNTVQAAGYALLREAEQLQNLIRIGLNRIPDNEGKFDLFDLFEDTLQPFSRVAHNKGLELVLDITTNMPTLYQGNAHIIGQILSNIIENAIQYTEHGEILIQVKPWQNSRVRFSVTDTGPGIRKEMRERLFNFPDNPNIDSAPKDVHLGLPITKYLIGLLGGQLTLSSELRMGTTVWADIPLTVLEHQETPISSTPLPLEEFRLMVVDDNLTCRKVIEHQANSWGMEVFSMSNGQSALANLHNEFHKGNPIDVIVVDQNMPNMGGTELIQRIRQDNALNKNIVAVIMSGADEVITEISEQDTGVQFILSKPVSARALRETLKIAQAQMIKNRESYHVKTPHLF